MALIGFLVTCALLVVPFWYLLPRAGISAPVAFLAAIPLVAVVLLWVMAFKRWPGDDVSGRF